MKNILLGLLLLLAARPAATAQQAARRCDNYACVMEQVSTLLAQSEKNYQLLLDKLDSAEGFAEADKAEIRAWRKKVFEAIEAEKEAAKAAERKATKASAEARRQTGIAQKAREAAEQEKQKATTALAKANKLVNAFYFYADRFALAYGQKDYNHVFYFIDKNGDEVPKLHRWEKAEQFDWRGFAKVRKKGDNQDYLLDTLGNTYPVAYDVKDLKPGITALDLSGKALESLPDVVLQHNELKTLLLNNNPLTALPSEIGKLTNLTTLNLNSNQFTALPPEIGKLTNLTALYLGYNQLTALPPEIGELTNLTELYLWHNRLTALPPEIGKLTNLTTLNLKNNPLSSSAISPLFQWLPKCEIKFNGDYFFERKDYTSAFLIQQRATEQDKTGASVWYNLSWYALFARQPRTAIEAAQKVLALDPERQSVAANLALGYLLDNQWPEAEKVYAKWKGKTFPDGGEPCNKLFLQDIAELEAAGIVHPDFEKVKAMLKE